MAQVRRRAADCSTLTESAPADSNDEMTGDERGAAGDVVTAGREPRKLPAWPGGLVWLLVIAEAAALAGLAVVALHYRSEVGRFRHGQPEVARRTVPPPLPRVTSAGFRLPADGTIVGTVIITAAAQPGTSRAQFTVSAAITGGRPDAIYHLTGNNCSSRLPDHVWATGRSDAAGAATLTGHPWTGAVTGRYWLALTPSPVNPPGGLRGRFAQAMAEPFPAGLAPCVPSP